ncbi:MAG: trypsin-like peptidase domain-containing protein [Planctomycetota bacterium]|nr:trypsin-like peptidase domain-containing protein [Planctomycetota bacterium]
MGTTLGLFLAALVLEQPAQPADAPLADVARRVDARLVKLYGAGGVKGLPAYGTGVVVSPTGYVLTINNHLLDTSSLRVHMADGTRLEAKLIAAEPELDLALLKIDDPTAPDDLPYFDIGLAAKAPPPRPGTLVLGFSNQFQIATRDEPLTVQRGMVAAIAPLAARIGVFQVPYRGPALVVDAITNNPGAAGGALTTRQGQLLGIVGREVSNELTQTWINYAIPVWASFELTDAQGKSRRVSLTELVEKKEAYKPSNPADRARERAPSVETGIILVPDVVERTPAYVDAVRPVSPASRAGLQPDDLILAVEGMAVPSIGAWREILSGRRPDEPMRLEIRRGDKIEQVVITPVKLPATAPPKPANNPLKPAANPAR